MRWCSLRQPDNVEVNTGKLLGEGARVGSALPRAILAGVAYFSIMFAIGFVLGTVRVMVLAPALGEWGAAFAELPIMLGISWVTAAWLIARLRVAQTSTARLVMGLAAFALLMIAEVLLGIGLFGRTLSEQLGAMTEGAGLAGLLGQVAFAAFPLAQLAKTTRIGGGGRDRD